MSSHPYIPDGTARTEPWWTDRAWAQVLHWLSPAGRLRAGALTSLGLRVYTWEWTQRVLQRLKDTNQGWVGVVPQVPSEHEPHLSSGPPGPSCRVGKLLRMRNAPSGQTAPPPRFPGQAGRLGDPLTALTLPACLLPWGRGCTKGHVTDLCDPVGRLWGRLCSPLVFLGGWAGPGLAVPLGCPFVLASVCVRSPRSPGGGSAWPVGCPSH